jgi:AraC-like DNA-binding protein
MHTILIIATFQAVLLAILLLAKKGKGKSDYILSGYFVVSALSILFAYLEIVNRSSGYPFPWLINISIPLILLVGPALWLYVKSLTQQYFNLSAGYLLLLVPFAFVAILFSFKFYLQPNSIKVSIDQTESFRSDFVFPLVMGLIALSNIGYAIWGIKLIGGYQKLLKTYFSKTDTIDLNWLKFVQVSALICYAAISGLYIISSALGVLSYNVIQVIGYALASGLILVLGFYGLKQGNIFVSVPEKFDMQKALDFPELKDTLKSDEEKFVHQLLTYTKNEKPYQNPDLTLAGLSDELKVSPEYLSGILNGRLGLNFFDFVNHYRVEDFKTLCKDPKNKNITLIGLAYNCGFNSKATFNRVFKKSVGCTPSEYLRKIALP